MALLVVWDEAADASDETSDNDLTATSIVIARSASDEAIQLLRNLWIASLSLAMTMTNFPAVPICPNFSLVTSGKSLAPVRASCALLKRGVWPIVTERWAQDAVDVMAQKTNAPVTDGEVVWS